MSIDRRAFLGASASAAVGLLAGRSAVAAEEAPAVSLGVQSYTFRNFDLEPALKRMKELGLKHAEFYSKHIPTDSSPEKLKGILELCKSTASRRSGSACPGSRRTTPRTRRCSTSARPSG